MAGPEAQRNPVEQLAEEFLARYRQGERPPLTEYTQKHPELAEEIRELFPALVMMEEIGPGRADPAGVYQGAVTADGQALVQLGEYRIVREVGRGGMGVVYEAEQEALGRHVALKVLPFQAATDPVRLQRFRREARSAARLHHSNIVPVFDVGCFQGIHYYAMQFIRGHSLGEVLLELRRLRGGRADPAGSQTTTVAQERLAAGDLASSLVSGRWAGSPSQAEGQLRIADCELRMEKTACTIPNPQSAICNPQSEGVAPSIKQATSEFSAQSDFKYYRSVARVGLQVAEALAYAHGQNILHRDIKPANLLLDLEGVVWVTDFGLAKDEGGDLTRTGDLVGTLRYMAPERFSGLSDARSDVYSLGLTLYELLTLQPAFQESDRGRLIKWITQTEPPRPRKLDRRVPRDLETIVLKASAKEPAHRYATAHDLAEDLSRFLSDRPIRARRTPTWEQAWRWCRRNPGLALASGLAALAVAAVLILSLTFGFLQGRAADRTSRALRETDRLTASLALDRAVSLCERGDVEQGLLWLARALQIAHQVEDADLQRVIRANWSSWRRQLHSLRGYLVQEGPIRAIAFSPDSRKALTGGEDGTARLWDTASGEPLGEPVRHASPVLNVLFHPEGERFFTITQDGSACCWETGTQKAAGPALVHGSAIRAAGFSPDGKTFLTAGDNHLAKLWDFATLGNPITVREERPIRTIVFSPGGESFVTASDDGRLQRWDTATGKALGPLLTEKRKVCALAFSPDGGRLLIGCEDGLVILRDLAAAQSTELTLRHTARIHVAAFSPDGKTALTASRDWKAWLWDGVTGKKLPQVLQHLGPVETASFSPDGESVLTGSWDAKAAIWDVRSGTLLHNAMLNQSRVQAAHFSPDGKLVMALGEDGVARLWEVAAKGAAAMVLPHPDYVGVMAFSPDGRLVALGGEGQIGIWEVASGKQIGKRQVRSLAPTQPLVFSADSSILVVGSEDGSVRLSQTATGAPLALPPGTNGAREALPHDNRVTAVALSPDNKVLLIGTFDGTLNLWDLGTAKAPVRLQAHRGPVSAAVFSPDGQTFLTGSADFTARLWRTASPESIGPPLGHQGGVRAVAFTPDGRLALTGSDDKTVRFWEAATGQPVGGPLLDQGPIRTLACSPDGRTVFVGGWRNPSHLWDERTRKPIGVPLLHDGIALAAVFAADGTWVRTGSGEKAVRTWMISPPVEGDVEQIVLLTELATGLALDADGTIRVLEPRSWHERREHLRITNR
jgi:WD40 repeat protein/serine/threonine protein kinase